MEGGMNNDILDSLYRIEGLLKCLVDIGAKGKIPIAFRKPEPSKFDSLYNTIKSAGQHGMTAREIRRTKSGRLSSAELTLLLSTLEEKSMISYGYVTPRQKVGLPQRGGRPRMAYVTVD
jgi:hypothetical protein